MFRYYPEDFGELTVRVLHMDLVFDVFDDTTKVISHLTAEVRDQPIRELVLNAKDLEIITITSDSGAVTFEYDRDHALLTLSFERELSPKTRVTLRTETICHPSDHLLEGLYYDWTPPGAPPTQLTQCQQWGFQRLVPCIDDMTAKCTYTTTIIADERYTHLLSNGDVVEPKHPIGGGRARIRYENLLTPMATYLFFLGCGTYAAFSRQFSYPEGRTFHLEILVPPGTNPGAAHRALEILSDAVMWVHLFTGPDRYEQIPVRQHLLFLITERDRLRASGADPDRLQGIQEECARLVRTIVPGYTYTGTIYREIGMQNSDFGGMENVGNTTISTNRLLPVPEMTDPAFEYMVKVKVHEYYHNLNGSEVTGRSPFEIWLNEAVTVLIENQFHAFHAGEAYSRLQTVLDLLAPGSGTLALDQGAASLPIEPDGFNDPNDLITDITYVKGPEFVRMIETLMGKKGFARGLDLYHRRYRHGNASRAQWVQAMEEVAGQEFTRMAEGWLKQRGYPTLLVEDSYEETTRTLTLALHQSGFFSGTPWTFPFRWALVKESGEEIREIVHTVRREEETLVVREVEKPAFLSLNREYSFYGRVIREVSSEELYLQAEKDRDLVNRFIAFSTLFDREKLRLLLHPEADPDPRCLDLYLRLLSDEQLMETMGGQFLTIFESVPDERHAHRYQALYDVREKILRAIATRYEGELRVLFQSRQSEPTMGSSLHDEISAIKRQQVKNTCLAVLARLDTPEIHHLILEQWEGATRATDRLTAFGLYMDSSAPDKVTVLEGFEEESRKNLVSWESFLAVLAGNSSPQVVDLLTRVEQSDAFRIEQANDQRALYGRFAMNRKKSLQTLEGRAFLERALGTLAPINEYSTVRMLRAFDAIDRMEVQYHLPLVEILVRFLESLDAEKTPSVYNSARRILLGAPAAVRTYEEAHGPIRSLQELKEGG
jgi:aminopeptidase N